MRAPHKMMNYSCIKMNRFSYNMIMDHINFILIKGLSRSDAIYIDGDGVKLIDEITDSRNPTFLIGVLSL